MKKFFKIVAVIALLGGVTLGCTKDYTKEIEDLQKEDTQINSKITEIQNTIELLKKTDADFTTRISALETLVDSYNKALNGRIDNLTKTVNDLDAKFAGQISGILTDIDALKAKDAELQKAIDGLKDRMTDAEKAIVELQAWCQALQGQVDALAARIQSIVAAPAKVPAYTGWYDGAELTTYSFSQFVDTAILVMAFDVYPESAAKAITAKNTNVLVEIGYEREGNMTTSVPAEWEGPVAFPVQEVYVEGSRVYVKATVNAYMSEEYGIYGQMRHYVSLQVTGKDAAGEVCKVSAPVAATEGWIDLNESLCWAKDGEPFESVVSSTGILGFAEDTTTQFTYYLDFDNLKDYVPAVIDPEDTGIQFAALVTPLQSFEWTEINNGGTVKGKNLFDGAELCVELYDEYVTLAEAEAFLGFPEGTLKPHQMCVGDAIAFVKANTPDPYKKVVDSLVAVYLPYAKQIGIDETTANFYAPIATKSELNPVAVFGQGQQMDINARIINPEDFAFLYNMFTFSGKDTDFGWTASLPATLEKRDYCNTVGVTGVNAVVYSIAGCPMAIALNAVRVDGNEEATLKPIKADLYVPFGVDETPAAEWYWNHISWYGTDGELAIYEDAPWHVFTTKDGKKDEPVVDGHFCLWSIPSAKNVCDIHEEDIPYAKDEKTYIARSEEATERNYWDNVVTAKGAEVEFTIAARHADVKVDIVEDELVTISKTQNYVTFLGLNYADSVFVDAENWIANEQRTKADSTAILKAWYDAITFSVDSVRVDCEMAPASVYAQIAPSYDGWAVVVYGIEYGKSYEVFMSGTKDDITLCNTFSFVTMQQDFSIETTPYVVDGKVRVDGQSYEKKKNEFEYRIQDINFENLFVIKGLDKINAREDGSKVDVAATYTKNQGKGYIYHNGAKDADKMTNYHLHEGASEKEGYIGGHFEWAGYQGTEVTLKATLHDKNDYAFGDTTVTLWTIDPIKASLGGVKEYTMTPAQNLKINLDDSLVVYGAYVGNDPDIDYNEEFNMWGKTTGPKVVAGPGDKDKDHKWNDQIGKKAETPSYGQQNPVFDWSKATWTLNGQAWVPVQGTHYTVANSGDATNGLLTIMSDNITGTITVEVPCTISTTIVGMNPAKATFKATIRR